MTYYFTAAQQADIRNLIASKDWKTELNRAEFYSGLYSIMLQPDANNSDGGKDGAQLRLWLRGAERANNEQGIFSVLIREYTTAQAELRGINGEVSLQVASNNIADKLMAEFENRFSLSNYTAPTLGGVADTDATQVGETIFKQLGMSDTAYSKNAAWSGSLLFSMLGGNEVGRLLSTGSPSKLDSIDDLKNVIFAIQSFTTAIGNGVSLAQKAYPRVAALVPQFFITGIIAGPAAALASVASLSSAERQDFESLATDLSILTDTITLWRGSFTDGVKDMLVAGIQSNTLSTALLDLIFADTPAYGLYKTIDALGLEQVVDGLSRTLDFPGGDLKTVFADLVDQYGPAAKVLLVKDYSTSELAAMAESNPAVRKAFDVLSVVIVDGAADEYPQPVPAEWYLARAGMLHAMATGEADGALYEDKTTGITVGTTDLGFAGKHIVFGAGSTDGTSWSDTLFGTVGSDRLLGGLGADTLVGGEGVDLLEGGGGEDQYVMSPGDGFDVINAFGLLESDRDSLDLSGVRRASIKLARAGSDMLIQSDKDVIVVQNWFVGEAYQLKNIKFADESISAAELTQQCATEGLSPSETAKILVDGAMLSYGVELSKVDIIDSLFKDGKLWSWEYLARLGVAGADQPGLLDPHNIEQLLYDVFKLGNGSKADPLVFDLDGNGIRTTHFADGPNFDLDSNGFSERTGWVAAGDGFLAQDVNQNGIIDDGSELFGDQTILPDGSKATSGFDALKQFDSNHDGKIDNSDSRWDQLRIWRDYNSNGRSEYNELATLSAAGVSGIRLQYTQPAEAIDIGNQNSILQSGTFVRNDGNVGSVASLLFARNTAVSEPKASVEVTADVAALPDARGMGTVYSLHQAMMRDTGLKALVEKFVIADWDTADAAFQDVLYRWTGADAVAVDSRGPNVNAQHLKVLESLYGQTYVDSDGSGSPRQSQGYVLEFAFNALREKMFSQLLPQAQLAPYFSMLSTSVSASNKVEFDLTKAATDLKGLFDTSPDKAVWMVTEMARALHGLNQAETESFAKFSSEFRSFDGLWHIPLYADGRAPKFGTAIDDSIMLSDAGDVVFGGAGADTLYGGRANDYISGGVGDDTLDGGGGDDSLFGGAGNDRLVDTEGSNVFNGGAGDDFLGSTLTTAFWGPNVYIGGNGNDTAIGSRGADTYIFNAGDGQDIIRENQYNVGGDVLKFGDDIQSSDWTAARVGVDLVLADSHGLDKITIAQWFDSTDQAAYRIGHAEFADGTIWSAADMTERALTVYGTPDADVLRGLDNSEDIIHGLAGDDIIFGYAGNDKLYGDEGADTLYGGAGNDTLQGGSGNDNLDGEAGDDYLSGGAGDDRLYDDQGANTFDGGDGDDRLMSANTTAFWGPNKYIGGKGNDIIFGSRGGDTYLFNAGDGQDVIIENPYGGGTDVFEFGAGIHASDFSATRVGDSLVLSGTNGLDKLTFQDWFYAPSGYDAQIELFKFADGNVLTGADVVALIGAQSLAAK